jgi:hypothetical protein
MPNNKSQPFDFFIGRKGKFFLLSNIKTLPINAMLSQLVAQGLKKIFEYLATSLPWPVLFRQIPKIKGAFSFFRFHRSL